MKINRWTKIKIWGIRLLLVFFFLHPSSVMFAPKHWDRHFCSWLLWSTQRRRTSHSFLRLTYNSVTISIVYLVSEDLLSNKCHFDIQLFCCVPQISYLFTWYTLAEYNSSKKQHSLGYLVTEVLQKKRQFADLPWHFNRLI